MTYCKDCRTEFMVAEDEPCPRCGRYLGGARMGQRAEVALPEQSAQPVAQKTLMDAVREHFGFAQPEPPAAQQAPVPPPAPIDEPPRPTGEGQTISDVGAKGGVSLFVRLVWAIPVLIGWGLLGLMVFAGSGESIWIWVKWMAGGVLMVMVYTWFAKWHQRVAQTWRPAGESTVSASSPAPASKAALEGAPHRPTGEVQTTLDAVADGRVSLFMCLVWAIPVLIGWGLVGLLLSVDSDKPLWIWGAWMVGGGLVAMVSVWLEKGHQRVAQTWRPAGESTVPASSPAPAPAPKAALEGEPNRLAEEERTTVDVVANGCASLFVRLVLLVVLAIPALIGFAYMMITHWPGGGTPPLMWCLYLSVFVPPFVCLLTPDEELKALLREHPRFWKVWLWWVMPAVALFLSFPGIQSMIKW